MESIFRASLDTTIADCKDLWRQERLGEDNEIFRLYVNDGGTITVLDRLMGYSGCIRDVETGLFDKNGKFWLASGDFDIRKFGDITTREAIDKIKRNANTCTGE